MWLYLILLSVGQLYVCLIFKLYGQKGVCSDNMICKFYWFYSHVECILCVIFNYPKHGSAFKVLTQLGERDFIADLNPNFP